MSPASDPAPPPPLMRGVSLLARGDHGEAAAQFERARAAGTPATWRALALLGRGLCEELAGRPAAARESVRSAVAEWAAADPGGCAVALAVLGRALGEDPGAAGFLSAARRLAGGQPAGVLGSVLVELGAAAAERGEAQAAARDWRAAMASGDPASRAAAAANLGRLAAARGDGPAALALFADALAVDGGPHLTVVADGLAALASQAVAASEWESAEARLREALPLRRRARDARGSVEALHDLGVVHWRLGRHQSATRLLEEARRGAEEIEADDLRGAALRTLARVSVSAERLVIALAYAREAALAARTPDERRAAAAVLREVGEEGRRRGAAALSGEAFRAAGDLLADRT